MSSWPSSTSANAIIINAEDSAHATNNDSMSILCREHSLITVPPQMGPEQCAQREEGSSDMRASTGNSAVVDHLFR